MTQPARQISKGKLLQLVKAADQCSSRMAEERGALGAKFEAAATADNFNAKAFRFLRPLLKMEAGPQAHLWRTIMLYASHLDIGTQSDIEDVINEDAAREAGEEDGSEDAAERPADARSLADEDEDAGDQTDPVGDVLAGMDVPEVGRFRTYIQEAGTVEAVSVALERFSSDHPDHAKAALSIAQLRLETINAELGGGEDLRAKTVQDGEKANLEQTADAAAAAPAEAPAKPKRTRSKPSSPAVDAARSNGIGDTFGAASPKPGAPVVH